VDIALVYTKFRNVVNFINIYVNENKFKEAQQIVYLVGEKKCVHSNWG